MKRIGWRRWLVISGALLFTGLVLAVVGLLYTQPGLQFAWERAQPWVPEALEIERLEGRLVGPVRLEGIHWEDEELATSLEAVELEWRAGMLLLGTLQVDRLALTGLELSLEPETDPGETAAEPFELPESISLPLRLRVADFSLREAELTAPGLDPPLRIERLDFAGGYAGEQLQLDQLDLAGPDLAASGSATLRTAEKWPFSVATDWSVEWPELPPLAGTTALDGDLERVTFQQGLSRPFQLESSGELSDPLGDPGLDGNFRFRELRATRFDPDAPAGVFQGDLAVRGDPQEAEVRGELEARETDYGDWALEMDVAGPLDLAWLQADRLVLEQIGRDLRLELSGRIEEPRGERPAFYGELDWRGLAWPLNGEPDYRSDSGWARIQGHAEAFEAELAAELAGEWEGETREADLELDARGSLEYLEDFQGRLALRDGPELRLAGSADWRDAERVAAGDFEIRDFDPALVAPDWPGMLSATGSGRIHWPDSGIEGGISLEALEGRLLGEPLAARGGIEYQPGRIGLRQFELESGEDRVRGDGILQLPGEEGRSDLDFELALTDLGRLPLELRGEVSAAGRLGGTPERAELDLELQARELARGEEAIGALELEADIADGGFGTSQLALQAREIRVAGEAIPRLALNAAGTREDHRLAVQLDHALSKLELELAGGSENLRDWIGRVDELQVRDSPAGDWALAEPAALEWRDETGRLAETCLASATQRGRVCLNGTGDSQGRWEVGLDGHAIPLAQFLDGEETGLALSGDMNLAVEARDTGDGPEAEGSVWLSPAVLSQVTDRDDPDEDRHQLTLAQINAGQGSFRWGNNEAWALLDVQLAEQGRLNGQARIPDLEAGTLEGRVDIFLGDLGILPVLIPEVGRAEGQLDAGLDLTGELGNPGLDGDIRIENGVLGLPDLGIVMEQLFVRLQGSPEAVRLALDAESDGGSLEARGEVDRIEEGWRGELRIQGDHFRAARLPEAEVYISPDLRLAVDGRRIDVTGELGIPRARIRPREMRAVIQPSPDEILVGDLRDNGLEPERYQVYSRVRTTLGEDVDFSGFGLEGHIRGSITTIDEPGRLTRAIGELEIVDGRYEAWRQRLEIERGRLIYTDTPIQDPTLDVRAVRRPRNVVVGVQVRGTLRQPHLELFSEPGMSQSEQLSYLLTGMPLTETGEGDRDVVREAAAALRMAGGEYVGERLGRRLGVDDVSIETGEGPDETTVVLGKWISSDVYVSYGIGLLDTASVFRLRYNMSRRWDLEAQSGARAGADFIYSLERGRPDD